MADNSQNILEAEVIYGAMQREKIWKIAFSGMTVAAVVSVCASAAVMVWHQPPAPIVVPSILKREWPCLTLLLRRLR